MRAEGVLAVLLEGICHAVETTGVHKIGTRTDSWAGHFKAANKVNSLKGPQLTSSRSLVNI